jgi:hypothetical protein
MAVPVAPVPPAARVVVPVRWRAVRQWRRRDDRALQDDDEGVEPERLVRARRTGDLPAFGAEARQLALHGQGGGTG